MRIDDQGDSTQYFLSEGTNNDRHSCKQVQDLGSENENMTQNELLARLSVERRLVDFKNFDSFMEGLLMQNDD